MYIEHPGSHLSGGQPSWFDRVNFGQRGGRMLGTVKIMAFEDEPLIGLFLQEALQDEGFEVVLMSTPRRQNWRSGKVWSRWPHSSAI